MVLVQLFSDSQNKKENSAEIHQLSSYPLTGAKQADKNYVICSSPCQGTGVELNGLEGPFQATPFYDSMFTKTNSQTLSRDKKSISILKLIHNEDYFRSWSYEFLLY